VNFQPFYLVSSLFFLPLLSIYPIAAYLLKTKYPFIVVMGKSMQPTLNPGDMLIIKGINMSTLQVGDILVFKPKWLNKLIIHRAVKIDYTNNETKIFTKGDALKNLDIIYAEPNEILGRLSLRLPRIAILPYIFWTAYEKIVKSRTFVQP
jgi:signal peptidase I